MTKTEIRTILRTAAAERDAKHRITATDEVHFYGRMPNSIETGWYFVGFGAKQVAIEFRDGLR